MEAANKGATEAGGKSIGLSIELPREQIPNNYQNISLHFKYFFCRKVMFLKYAHGFIVLPDMSELVADLEVRETEIGQLMVGQLATIRPHAYPQLELTGRVTTIGTLASGEDTYMPRFQVRIAIDGVDPRLRPGMTAMIRIQTGNLEHAVRVPVEAVFYSGDQTVCFRWSATRVEPVEVEIGPSDGRHVVVTRGLAGGEKLLLHDPREVIENGTPPS